MTQITEASIPAIRDLLWEAFQKSSDESASPAQSNATANLGGKLLGTYKLQLELLKLANRQPDADLLRQLGLPAPAEVNGKK